MGWYWCIIWYNLVHFCTFSSDFKNVLLPWDTLYHRHKSKDRFLEVWCMYICIIFKLTENLDSSVLIYFVHAFSNYASWSHGLKIKQSFWKQYIKLIIKNGIYMSAIMVNAMVILKSIFYKKGAKKSQLHEICRILLRVT